MCFLWREILQILFRTIFEIIIDIANNFNRSFFTKKDYNFILDIDTASLDVKSSGSATSYQN